MRNIVSSWFNSPNTWIWLTPVLLIVPNLALAITESYPWMMKVALLLLPFGIWSLLTGWFKHTGTVMLCLFPIYVFCAFQIVLLYLYGESIIAIDMFMNVMTTNPGEVTELLGNLKMALLTVFVLYLPPIIWSIILTARKAVASVRCRRRILMTGIISLSLGIIFLCASIFLDGEKCRPSRQIFPYNVISNLVTSIEREVESRHYHESSAAFSHQAVTTRPDSVREIYVMVIGETSRADNWNIFGYDRDTNPRLSKRTGLVGYPYALSEINTTHKSVPLIMSVLDSETFGCNVASTRSIFEAFNTAGYSTHFISNQHRNNSYIDFYGQEAQHSIFLTDSGSPHDDMDLHTALVRILKEDHAGKIFIVLHMYGSHFEYLKRYPQSESFFRPDGNTEATRLNRPQLINAYDNTIRHTDMILDSIIADLDAMNVSAGLIFASDHGEDIFDDDRERFLHASPVPTYHQLHVPMILWMSEEMQHAQPHLYQAAHNNVSRQVSSSRSMFHTMLQMAGLKTKFLEESQSLVSDHYKEPHRFYLNDYNESIPLKDSGLKDEDFICLNRHGFRME